MKKFIFAIMLVFGVAGAYAETSEITTSQYYVDTNAATRQDAAPANNANSVMTYDSTSPDGIGAKAIYDTTAAYGEQKSALVTAATANTAIQNGINSEFVCANPPKCNLWDLKGFYSTSLPAGYTELEYLESTGTQWLNLGQPIGSGNNISVKFEYTTDASGIWFGAREANASSVGFTFDFFARSNTVFIIANKESLSGYRGYYAINLTVPGEQYVLNWHGKPFKTPTLSPNQSFTTYGAIDESNYLVTPPYNAYLFAYNQAGQQSSKKPMRIYYFKVEGKMNLIPAKRNSDNVLGMYDTVSGTFFTNAATSGDDFIAGPVASFIPQNQ